MEDVCNGGVCPCGSGACRVARISLSGKESEGKNSAIERASYGRCGIVARFCAGRVWH